MTSTIFDCLVLLTLTQSSSVFPISIFNVSACHYFAISHLVTKSCSTLLQPHGLLCAWEFPGKNTEVGCHLPLSGMELTSPALAGSLFTTEPLRTPRVAIYSRNIPNSTLSLKPQGQFISIFHLLCIQGILYL